MTNTATEQATGSLTAMDRCDRCGAQAYLRVELSSGGELLFCAHHANKHREKLAQVAANPRRDGTPQGMIAAVAARISSGLATTGSRRLARTWWKAVATRPGSRPRALAQACR